VRWIEPLGVSDVEVRDAVCRSMTSLPHGVCERPPVVVWQTPVEYRGCVEDEINVRLRRNAHKGAKPVWAEIPLHEIGMFTQLRGKVLFAPHIELEVFGNKAFALAHSLVCEAAFTDVSRDRDYQFVSLAVPLSLQKAIDCFDKV
jgi:hypothetical protein